MSATTDKLNALKAKMATEIDEVTKSVNGLKEEIRLLKEQGGNDPEVLAVIEELTVLADTISPNSPETLTTARAKIAQLAAKRT